MSTPALLPLPVRVADELVTLAHRAIDQGRPSAPYMDHAEAILNAYEATGDATAEVQRAVAWIGAV